jgi:predicted transcriptional regulator
MDEQERAALEEAIEEGLADADAGRVVEASVVLEKLRARSRG